MKIPILSTRFHPHVGGVENVIENISREISEDKHEVVVLTSLNAGLLKVEEDLTKYQNYKVKRIWMGIPRSVMGYAAFPVRFPIALYKLMKFVKEFNPDVINFHFPDDASLYVWLLNRFVKKAQVVNIHGNDIQVFARKNPYKIWIKSILTDASSIVVNSEYMKSQVELYDKSLESKIVIVANGLNISEIKSVHPQKYTESPYIFYVGRLVHKKGIDVLINAFKKAKIADLELLIEGSGEESESIKQLIKESALEDKIFMTHGKLTNEQKTAFMKGSMFGVMPSRIEPFGIVALEFLAAGTPLIASKTGGLKTILEDQKTCLFFENENTNELCDKIKLMYENTGMRMKLSVNGQQEAEKYDWKKISSQYLTIFKKI